MAPSRLIERDEPVVVTNTATLPQRASRLPRALRFPILLTLDFCIHYLLWSVVNNFLPQELGAASKVENDPVLATAHIAFRVGFLWFTWRSGYDWIDVSALTVLTSAPYAYLLATYYSISTLMVASFVNIEVLSIALPTLLLRPRSKIHNPRFPVRNRFLLDSFQVQATTALLAIGVYVTILWASLKTGKLNEFLITHFDIHTLEDAHRETPLSLAIKVVTSGIAARTFLLNPSMASQSAVASPVDRHFDPATATFQETIKHNFWFFSQRTKTLIKQTVVLVAFMFANTVQRTMTLKGADWKGAVGYSGLWIAATGVLSAWWAWVGDTSPEV